MGVAKFIKRVKRGVSRVESPGPSLTSLIPGLISHWKLNEASSFRGDSHGTNILTDNGSTASVAGKIGNAANFVAASSQSLSRASGASLVVGGVDFTVSAWVRLTSKPASTAVCIAKDLNTAPNREYRVDYLLSTDRFRFVTFGGGSTSRVVSADNFGPVALATWYFLVCWQDVTQGKIFIQVNNGTPNELAFTGAITDSVAEFRIGASANPVANFWNGPVDSVSFWKRILTANERTALWNGGAGLDYEAFPSVPDDSALVVGATRLGLGL